MLTEDEIKGLKFEEGLKKLEELVTHLDDGNLSLEESISYYEIGIKLKSHCEKLLKNMMRVPKENREAKFRTVLAYKDDNRELCCDGSVNGEIAQSPRGSFGFGYDSVFYYPPLEKTFAELSEEEKNSISHRGRALRNFLLLFNNKK